MVQLHLVVLTYLSLQLLGQFLGLERFNFCHLHSLSVFIVITANNKLSLHGQLLGTEAQSLLGNLEGNALDLEEDTTRSHRSDPSCGITLTFTHTYISRFTSNGFVREDANPYLTLTVHITVDGNTGCLNLAAVNPLRIKGLDAEATESQLRTAVGVAFVATSVLRSSISYSLRL